MFTGRPLRAALPLARRGFGSIARNALLTDAQRAVKSRQRQALERLEHALIKLDAPDDETAVLRESLTTLESLFLTCIVGEFNAGKSAFVNALLGGQHCEEGVLPTTDTVTLLKHPSVPFNPTGGTAGVVPIDVNVDWLRELHLVDTPGTNSINETHTALTRHFLPRADLVLFVTSVERPFTESEQAFLRSISEWRKPVIFVLNKADLLPADELERVREYVATNAAAALGAQPEVLAVSAKAALALKAAASASELGASLGGGADAAQWEALERRVLGVLRRAGRLKLESQLAVAGRLLEVHEGAAAKASALVDADAVTVGEARARIERFERATRAELDAQVARSQLVLATLQQRGHKFLHEELTIMQLPRLLSRDAFVTRFEKVVVADTAAQLERAALATAEWVDARGALLHEETRELLLRATKGGGESGGGYAARRQQHLLAMQGAARGALEAYDPKTSAQRLLASVHTALAQTAVLQAGAAGVSGMVAVKAASLVDLTGLLPAALLAVTGFAVLPVQRYRLQADLQQRVAELTATLDTALRGHLEEELQHASSRARDIVAPFAAEADAAAAEQRALAALLAESREEVEAIAKEVAGAFPER